MSEREWRAVFAQVQGPGVSFIVGSTREAQELATYFTAQQATITSLERERDDLVKHVSETMIGKSFHEAAVKRAEQAEADRDRLERENALQRKQLRNAWAKLGCRCIFDDEDRKTHEDDHCPYHGVYQRDPDGWDPIGDLEQLAVEAREALRFWFEEKERRENTAMPFGATPISHPEFFTARLKGAKDGNQLLWDAYQNLLKAAIDTSGHGS